MPSRCAAIAWILAGRFKIPWLVALVTIVSMIRCNNWGTTSWAAVAMIRAKVAPIVSRG